MLRATYHIPRSSTSYLNALIGLETHAGDYGLLARPFDLHTESHAA